jgi:uncharacterized damage-inducible protein DinB
LTISAEVLRTQLEYSQWANRLLVDVAGTLGPEELTRNFGTADKSVLGTLVHIYASERTWLNRLLGEPPAAFATDADYRLSVVQEDWPALWQRWKEWADGVTDSVSHNSLSYKDLRGNDWKQPVWQIVLHVVNHSTHHRGQVSGFLRSMGHTPPPLDLIRYYRDAC